MVGSAAVKCVYTNAGDRKFPWSGGGCVAVFGCEPPVGRWVGTGMKRVWVRDLWSGCGEGSFLGRGIGDGDGLLRGVVVWHCLLARIALVNGRRARKKPTQGRGDHAGRDGVDCLWFIGTAWRASWHTGMGSHGRAGPGAQWGCFRFQGSRSERAGDSLIFCCEMVAGSVGGWCTCRSIAPSNRASYRVAS